MRNSTLPHSPRREWLITIATANHINVRLCAHVHISDCSAQKLRENRDKSACAHTSIKYVGFFFLYYVECSRHTIGWWLNWLHLHFRSFAGSTNWSRSARTCATRPGEFACAAASHWFNGREGNARGSKVKYTEIFLPPPDANFSFPIIFVPRSTDIHNCSHSEQIRNSKIWTQIKCNCCVPKSWHIVCWPAINR